jgi:hypothetical protein
VPFQNQFERSRARSKPIRTQPCPFKPFRTAALPVQNQFKLQPCPFKPIRTASRARSNQFKLKPCPFKPIRTAALPVQNQFKLQPCPFKPIQTEAVPVQNRFELKPCPFKTDSNCRCALSKPIRTASLPKIRIVHYREVLRTRGFIRQPFVEGQRGRPGSAEDWRGSRGVAGDIRDRCRRARLFPGRPARREL